MKINVIIPLYNKETEINRTLDMLFKQSFQDFEVVIVDDGSTDSSVEIVKNYNNKKIHLYSQQNKGAAAARNKGVELANSEWIAFLDADDEWKNDYLEKIVKTIQSFPDVVLVGTNYEIVENGETIVLDYPLIEEDEAFLKNYFISGKEYTPLWTSAVVMRKDVFEQLGGFPEECKTCEDVDLWCRVALTGKIFYINKPLAVYYRGQTSMLSKTQDTTCYYPFLDNFDSYIKEKSALRESVEDYVVYRQLVAVSFQLFNTGNRALAKRILAKVKYNEKIRKKYFFLKLMLHMPKWILDFYSKSLTKIIHKQSGK